MSKAPARSPPGSARPFSWHRTSVSGDPVTDTARDSRATTTTNHQRLLQNHRGMGVPPMDGTGQDARARA